MADPSPTSVGCCSSCQGSGLAADGACWDCRGTGCCHPPPLCADVEHDERCCMTGVPASSGPHPDCPGWTVLRA